MTKDTTKHDDGGPAFPESVAVDHMDGLNFSRNQGMSLRDYFAAKALASLGGVPGSHLMPENLARDCYAHADAMLAERAK